MVKILDPIVIEVKHMKITNVYGPPEVRLQYVIDYQDAPTQEMEFKRVRPLPKEHMLKRKMRA